MGQIVAVCTSEKKGERKKNIHQGFPRIYQGPAPSSRPVGIFSGLLTTCTVTIEGRHSWPGASS